MTFTVECSIALRQNKLALTVRDDPSRPDQMGLLRLKNASEAFGEKIVTRLPAIEPDLTEAYRSYAYDCNAACAFHLLRATEIAVPKIAKMCALIDSKPSWGKVLDHAEKYTQKTEYENLPDTLKPHIEFLRTIVADMRSMQRAWRNKVVHVEDKIIPTAAEFSPRSIRSMFSAVESFLNHLADGLPEWC